jgi:hypothetical protein
MDVEWKNSDKQQGMGGLDTAVHHYHPVSPETQHKASSKNLVIQQLIYPQ